MPSGRPARRFIAWTAVNHNRRGASTRSTSTDTHHAKSTPLFKPKPTTQAHGTDDVDQQHDQDGVADIDRVPTSTPSISSDVSFVASTMSPSQVKSIQAIANATYSTTSASASASGTRTTLFVTPIFRETFATHSITSTTSVYAAAPNVSRGPAEASPAPGPHLSPLGIAMLTVGIVATVLLSCFALKRGFRKRALVEPDLLSENDERRSDEKIDESPVWGGQERTGRMPWDMASQDPNFLTTGPQTTSRTNSTGTNHAGFGRGGEWKKLTPTPRLAYEPPSDSSIERLSDTSLGMSDPENAVIQTASRTSVFPAAVSSTSFGQRAYVKAVPEVIYHQQDTDIDSVLAYPLGPVPKLMVVNASPSSSSLERVKKIEPPQRAANKGTVNTLNRSRPTSGVPYRGNYHKTGKVGLGLANYSTSGVSKSSSARSLMHSSSSKLSASGSNDRALLYPLPSFGIPLDGGRLTQEGAGKLDRTTKTLTSALGLTSPPSPIGATVEQLLGPKPRFVYAVTDVDAERSDMDLYMAYDGTDPLSPMTTYPRSESQSPQSALGRMMLKEYDSPGGIASPSLPHLKQHTVVPSTRAASDQSRSGGDMKPFAPSKRANRLTSNLASSSALANAVANARSAHSIQQQTRLNGKGTSGRVPVLPPLARDSVTNPQHLPSLRQMLMMKNEPDYRSPTYSIYGLYDEAAAATTRNSVRRSWTNVK